MSFIINHKKNILLIKMSLLFHGDCLEEMKNLDDSSIDLIFCDLPYGQISCEWDKKINLSDFWIQIMRIKKLNTPIFFTTTTKFGVDLITSAPKKCPFRYDLVWIKSSAAGFLSAKKMPMRKHEMIYVFYEKLPLYDLSSHTHKFIKEFKTNRGGKDKINNKGVIKNRSKSGMEKINKYDPPLPVSVVKEDVYGMGNQAKIDCCINDGMDKKDIGGKPRYDPPLPVSVVKEELAEGQTLGDKGNECYGKFTYYNNGVKGYDPPLPVSVVKEPEPEPENCNYDVTKNTYGGGKKGRIKISKDKKDHQQKYDPPLPVSVVSEEKTQISKPKNKDLYGDMKGGTIGNVHGTNYEPPLPVSVVKEPQSKKILNEKCLYGPISIEDIKESGGHQQRYNPPLPDSLLEIKSTRGKHSTEKPIELMKWILKYYSKEGDVVLDPTMGSGSTGVSCKEMNRNFIGIEKDPEIYEVAVNRIEIY